ncbi:MAG: methyltransferase type 12 [Acidobacteriaceae bacterium]|nr:methyltransferase type 12 [Acidobacteriaceae bacterium]
MQEQLSASPQRTFRDPAGSIEVRSDGAFRSVHPAYATDMLAFLDEPLATGLVSAGLLISTTVMEMPSPVSTSAESPDSEAHPLHLRHPRVSFPSYPWEWSPALWLSASELTLNLCSDLLKEGWILKDATPLNILFQGVEPVFVDVLSIQRADLRQPVWFAYGQFVRTFLLPMLAHSRLGWPLQVALTRRDGFEPEEIYAALPWTQRLRQPALSSVTLPLLLSRLTSSRSTGTSPVGRTVKNPEVARHILLKTLAGLLTQMRRATPPPGTSDWESYTQTASHYSTADHTAKQDFVRKALTESLPARVLDVGCNTGVYSRLAAKAGAEVVAIDTDLQAVDRLATSLRNSSLNILPLCVDLAYPTPPTGWQNRESRSFLDRTSGHFDTVLMLAVLHHLLLQSQIPLGHIATLCNTLTTRTLILEWVPPTDSMFQQLLRGREALYTHLTEAAFREAFAPYFTIQGELTLPNQRILFHFVRRQG